MDLLSGFQEKKFLRNKQSIAYHENPRTFFEVTFHSSIIQPETEIAYLSWIEGKGSGIRLLGYLLKKLNRRSINNNRTIKLFIEPTTQSGSDFIEKLRGLGFVITAEDSEINWGCRGYSIEVNQEALNVLACEA